MNNTTDSLVVIKRSEKLVQPIRIVYSEDKYDILNFNQTLGEVVDGADGIIDSIEDSSHVYKFGVSEWYRCEKEKQCKIL